MKQFPTLYKFASSGKVQQWTISAGQYQVGGAFYSTEYGQQGGSLQETTVDITEGKNVGKKNETSPYQQALSEAESKWKKKQDKGYSPNAPQQLKVTSPMLAKSYDKEKKKVKFPCIYQPKLDGMRCIAAKVNGIVNMFSRGGKPIDTLPHINSLLEELMDDGEILDGELYTHGVAFQKVISWIKRNQPDSVKVQYNVYDMINSDAYPKRFKRICRLIGKKGKGIIRTVYTDVVNSHAEIAAAHKEQCARGFEGIMLRLGKCEYKIGRRSSDLLKVKKFFDEEFEIIGAFENIGKQKGQCTFTCVTKTGATFNVKPMGTSQEREQYWTDWQSGSLKGNMLTVRFFEWTTSTPKVPRFPIGVTIRDYE
jgi:DNA ligase-1